MPAQRVPLVRRSSICRADAEVWTSQPLIAISTEYAQLCQAQFEVLSATVGAARCAVYFRREHPLTGALEFVPVAVYPQSQSVWVVGQNGDLPIVGPRELPGSTPATTLIPSYPFVRQVCRSISLACAAFVLWRGVQVENQQRVGGGGGGSGCGLLLPDGGITFPLVVDTVIVGVLTIWRHGERGTGASRGTQRGPLSPAECECAAAVARSLALSTMLDQRLLWSGMHADSRTEEALLSQVGHSLRTSVHQLGSPLAALQLFSKLILRRLPPSDSATRQLVREIVSQAGRAQQLVGPLQALASQLPPLRRPELAGAPGEGADGGVAVGGGLPAHGSAGASVLGERQLLWLPDLLRPLAVSFSQLAAAQGARLEWRLDEDAPPVRACELEVREAVSNLLENALRYGTGLLALSLVPIHALPSEAADAAAERAAAREEEGGGERELEGMPDGVCLFVWNSGPGIAEAELARVFEPGFRGVRSQQPGARGGSGLGLSIARELIAALGGGIALRNAPAPLWLRERGLPVRAELLQSGTLAQIVLPRARFSSRSRAATDLI